MITVRIEPIGHGRGISPSDPVRCIAEANGQRQLMFVEADRNIALDAMATFILTLKHKAIGV